MVSLDLFIYYMPYFIQLLYVIGLSDKFNSIDEYLYNSTFIIYGMIIFFIVLLRNISFYYYNNTLLLYYILQTLLFYIVLNQKFNARLSVCLSLSFSFIASFYWEIPIHIYSLLAGEPLYNIVWQLLHLATLPFIFRRFKVIDEIRFKRYILYGLIFFQISALISFEIKDLLNITYAEYLNFASRLVGAICIIIGVLKNIEKIKKE